MSETLNMVVRDSEDFIITNWGMWTRWFHDNTGIGNSLNMWWPSRKGQHAAWVLCDRCGLPFRIPTGFHLSSLPGGESTVFSPLEDLKWTGGPCTRCRTDDGVIATGTPILTIVSDPQGRMTIAGSDETAMRAWAFWQQVTEGLIDGSATVDDVAEKLRGRGGPLTRLADWLEARPVTTTAAGAIIVAIAGLVGPQLAATNSRGADDERMVEIIDTVLDHYDRVHKHTAERGPAKSGRTHPEVGGDGR